MNNASQSLRSLVLGVDTGGTYTDGVLLRYDTHEVLSSKKCLTTKRDLSIGVEEVIKGISIPDPSAVQMVSISTTLATNAVAEGKGRTVALFLIGYDPELMKCFRMEPRFATPHYYYFSGGHDLYGREKDALDISAVLGKASEVKNQVEAIAVSSYFSPLNPEHENRVFQVVSEKLDLPIILGHHLSTKLGSVERATTAALNASLLSVLQDLVVAVRNVMERRQIQAPLMVVRGDGTLMAESLATRTPVETIHSGPAASAIGGRFLSGVDNALVVDIGGTTTDIALIQDGQVTIDEHGATINGYKTAVKAADLLTIAIGGDSHIAISDDGDLLLGPERAMPLAHMARQYPDIRDRLKGLSKQIGPHTSSNWFQYWFLHREPNDEIKLKSEHEHALIDLLREEPKHISEILECLDLMHVSQIDAQHLLEREIIGCSGLTPTDLLHAEGRFTPWDAEAATWALEAFCRCHDLDLKGFCRRVWNQMTETIVRAIVLFLSGKVLAPTELEDTDMGHWFVRNSLYKTHQYLETRFRLRLPIIGVGAPAAIFLKDVADTLQTELILPKHFEVANAVGAVAGTVMSSEEVIIYPCTTRGGIEIMGYYVQNGNTRHAFEQLQVALDFARTIGREHALDAAVRSGAHDPQVHIEEQIEGLDTYRIRVKVMGNPRLMR